MKREASGNQKPPPQAPERLQALAEGARCFSAEKLGEFEAILEKLVERVTVTPGGGHDEDCMQLVSDVIEYFKGLGLETWIQESGGLPCMVARCPPPAESQPAKMHIVIYNHMDVVPADEADGWTRKPFVFEKKPDEEEGTKYLGRGTTDDKGPALTALYGVLAAQRQGVSVDATFVWELEEEIGSPNFGEALTRLQPRLPPKIDFCICSDTIWIAEDLPTVVETVRGSVSFDIALETAHGDVHSGICGGAARNPLQELVHLGAELAGPDGVPRPPELQLPPVTPGAELLADVFGHVTCDGFKKDFGLLSLRVDDPALLLQRTWAEPVIEIVGVSGVYGGAGVKAAIPAKASLKLNFRLVAPQTPDETEVALKKVVAQKLPDAKVTSFGKMEPFDGRLSAAEKDALRVAYELGTGITPAFGRVGGSIGVLNTLRRQLGVQVLLPSLSSPSQGYHGINECYSSKRFQDGVVMYTVLIAELISQQQ